MVYWFHIVYMKTAREIRWVESLLEADEIKAKVRK